MGTQTMRMLCGCALNDLPDWAEWDGTHQEYDTRYEAVSKINCALIQEHWAKCPDWPGIEPEERTRRIETGVNPFTGCGRFVFGRPVVPNYYATPNGDTNG